MVIARMVLLLGILFSTAAAGAERELIPGCLLEVRDTTYIDGPCLWAPLPEGGFSITNYVFHAELHPTENDRADA